MTPDIAIDISGVSKRFRIPSSPHGTLKGRLLHPFQRTQWRTFDALNDVTVSIARGEFFGIVGRNGSGKSTLLKVMAGIYRANSGTVNVRGSIAPFIELGVGFHPELSGRENLKVNGVLLGLSRRELARRYDEIVDFAELHDFMDLKLRNYSSGMQVRLAFSVAIQSGADILLTDEVLAVGDERFQAKCYGVFEDRQAAGQTIILVTHDMSTVRRFCDRAMLLGDGHVTAMGEADAVTAQYHQINRATDERELGMAIPAHCDSAWSEQADGARTDTFNHGDTISLRMSWHAYQAVNQPTFEMIIRNDWGSHVMWAQAPPEQTGIDSIAVGEDLEVCLTFRNQFTPGNYTVSPLLTSGGDLMVVSETTPLSFTVAGTRIERTVVDLDHELRVMRTVSPAPAPALPQVNA